jgi:hypothetical protein
MATVALFIALGGGSYAAVRLTKNSVKAKHIARDAVSRPEIKARGVGTSEVAERSLLATHFKAGELPVGGANSPLWARVQYAGGTVEGGDLRFRTSGRGLSLKEVFFYVSREERRACVPSSPGPGPCVGEPPRHIVYEFSANRDIRECGYYASVTFGLREPYEMLPVVTDSPYLAYPDVMHVIIDRGENWDEDHDYQPGVSVQVVC